MQRNNAYQAKNSHANQPKNPTPFDFKPRLNIYVQLVQKGTYLSWDFGTLEVGLWGWE